MLHLSFNDVDYCKYGMPYRKRTRLWNNCPAFESKLCNRDCEAMDEQKRRHKEVAQQGVSKHSTKTHRMQELYMIPRDLVLEILRAIERSSLDPESLNPHVPDLLALGALQVSHPILFVI